MTGPSTTAPPAPRRSTSSPPVRRLGTLAYGAALDLQRALVAERALGRIPDTLLLLEHLPVVTLGRGGDPRNLVGTPAELSARGVQLVPTDRGGDVTFHGPGQIVGYAIVDLAARGRDLHRYLRDLEAVLIRALAAFGIDGERAPGMTGVWVRGAKVAAIGVRVSRWIAHHGFALNVDTDLSYFDLIVPCGLRGKPVTSMAALRGAPVDRVGVEDALARSFLEVFGER